MEEGDVWEAIQKQSDPDHAPSNLVPVCLIRPWILLLFYRPCFNLKDHFDQIIFPSLHLRKLGTMGALVSVL